MKMHIPNKQAAIYIRVSTHEQADKWTSIESQKEIWLKYAEMHNLTVKEENIYTDAGISWTMDEQNRPALNSLMETARQGKISAVITFKIDRIARKQLILLEILEELALLDVTFVSVTQNFDTSWYWKFITGMLGVLAELEGDLIRERTTTWKTTKAQKGYYVGGFVQYWFYTEKDKFWTKLFVDKEEAKVVNKIFEMYVNDDKSICSISQYLRANKVLTKYEKTVKNPKKVLKYKWDSTTIRNILKNTMYIWTYFYWKTYKRYDPKKRRKVTVEREAWDPLLVELQCPKVLKSPEIFYKAQEKLERDRVLRNKPERHKAFVGYIHCASCKKRYIGYNTSKWTISYRCSESITWKTSPEYRCKNPQISEQILIEKIFWKFQDMFKNPKEMLCKYYFNKENNVKKIQQYKDDIGEINKKISRQKIALQSAIKTSLLQDESQKEIYTWIIKELEEEMTVFLSEKKEMEEKIRHLENKKESSENINKNVEKFKSRIKNGMSTKEKIEFIKIFLIKITVFKDKPINCSLKFYNSNKTKSTNTVIDVKI